MALDRLLCEMQFTRLSPCSTTKDVYACPSGPNIQLACGSSALSGVSTEQGCIGERLDLAEAGGTQRLQEHEEGVGRDQDQRRNDELPLQLV